MPANIAAANTKTSGSALLRGPVEGQVFQSSNVPRLVGE